MMSLTNEEENDDEVNVADNDEIKHKASLTKKTENPHVQDVRNSQEGVQNLHLPPPFLNAGLPFIAKRCPKLIIYQ